MKARFKAIAASLALAAVATQAGEQARGKPNAPLLVAAHGVAVPSAESPARDPGSGTWTMLLAGVLGAGAIARRRM